ncbi:MAG: gamma-glutamylcyclotransferase [Planctomycetes bacterium]|nr:gamma-glutamylcyclotransferase [Planctomycetota bacterium]
MIETAATLRLFVYGTLKRGQSNHTRYFGDGAKVEPAEVRGRLFQLRQGYPMLLAPLGDLLAIGTADYVADGNRQQELSKAVAPAYAPQQDDEAWPLVRGEIIDLTEVDRRLPRIDLLEDFDAASGTGLYRRVLLWAARPRIAVWTYVAPDEVLPPGAVDWKEEWP